jgi:hypothetical protein
MTDERRSAGRAGIAFGFVLGMIVSGWSVWLSVPFTTLLLWACLPVSARKKLANTDDVATLPGLAYDAIAELVHFGLLALLTETPAPESDDRKDP